MYSYDCQYGDDDATTNHYAKFTLLPCSLYLSPRQ
jgi:hypothetical protein